MQSAPCSNTICAQYRIQHKNMTMKKLELEKELEHLKRLHANDFNAVTAQKAITPMRDPVTGQCGLMVRGEIMSAEKIMLKMDMAASSLSTLHALEKHNQKLVDENQALKRSGERSQGEIRRLEAILSKFEKSRKYDTFTHEDHKATLQLNAELADQNEALEMEVHILREEAEILKQGQRRANLTHSRMVDDDDSISSYIAADGRVPAECPCGCKERYEAQVLASPTPAEAFEAHMIRFHRCAHCRRLVPNKAAHEGACELKAMARVPRKKQRLDDEA